MSCGDPGSLANGFKIGDKFTYGERVIFDCNPGYKLQGPIIRECEANGQWSGAMASCIGEFPTFIIHCLFAKSNDVLQKWAPLVCPAEQAILNRIRLTVSRITAQNFRGTEQTVLVNICSEDLLLPAIFRYKSMMKNCSFL